MQQIISKRRVLVIGLDGATWTVLRPLMEQGYMPNLKMLVENGVCGDLASTIPSHSGPAWTSFVTGKNPGKHGIFGFIKPLDKNGRSGVICSNDIKSKTIFHVLSEAEKTVGFINLPTMFPPIKVNGFMVGSELLLPYLDSEFTYPKNLFEIIGWKELDYFIGTPLKFDEDKAENSIQELINRLEKRKNLTIDLLKKFKSDFMGVVFTETDTLQHYLWHILDTSHPRYKQQTSDKIRPLIINFFQKVDNILGDLVNMAEENMQIILISDHGFGPYEKHLGINMILEDLGFLRLKHKKRIKKGYLWQVPNTIRGYLNQNSIVYKFLKNIIKQLSKKHASNKIKFNQIGDKLNFGYIPKLISSINWSKTKAYYLSDTGSGIFINLKGRQPYGIINPGKDYEDIRSDIISLINNLKYPGNGRNLGIKAYRKEEVYSGEYLSEAPDIVIGNQTSYRLSFNFRDKIFQDTQSYTGFHRNNGIVTMYGNCFKKNLFINGAQIIDIAPIVLHLLGVAIPEDMDGKVIKDVFKEEFLNLNKINYQKSIGVEKALKDKDVYSNEEIAKIEQRLADLGYLA